MWEKCSPINAVKGNIRIRIGISSNNKWLNRVFNKWLGVGSKLRTKKRLTIAKVKIKETSLTLYCEIIKIRN